MPETGEGAAASNEAAAGFGKPGKRSLNPVWILNVGYNPRVIITPWTVVFDARHARTQQAEKTETCALVKCTAEQEGPTRSKIWHICTKTSE